MKVSKNKSVILSREVLTKNRTDWIDYWSADFDFENKREIIRVTKKSVFAKPQAALPGFDPPRMSLAEYMKRFGRVITSSKTSGNPSVPGKTGSLHLKASIRKSLQGGARLQSKWWNIFGNDTMTILDGRL